MIRIDSARQSELSALNERIKENEQQIAVLTVSSETANEQLRTAEAERDQLRTNIRGYDEEIKRLTGQCETAESELSKERAKELIRVDERATERTERQKLQRDFEQVRDSERRLREEKEKEVAHLKRSNEKNERIKRDLNR